MSSLKCPACGHRIILSASTIACENCGAPLPLEQELPFSHAAIMQMPSSLTQQPEVTSEMAALYDEHDSSSATVPLPPLDVPPEQARSLILRSDPSSPYSGKRRQPATRGRRSHSPNLPVLFSPEAGRPALYRPSRLPDEYRTNLTLHPSDVFSDMPRKYPFWFPRRPPDIVGSIIHIQEHSENSSMNRSLLKGLCDIVWVERFDPSVHTKQDRVHVTMLRLRLSDGTQKDARLEGYLVGAHLTLGDVLSLWGRQRHGIIIIRRAFNETSRAVVSTRMSHSSTFPLLLFLIILLLAFFIVYHWQHIPILPEFMQWLKD